MDYFLCVVLLVIMCLFLLKIIDAKYYCYINYWLKNKAYLLKYQYSKMISNNRLRVVDTKNRMYYYFDAIININDLDSNS